ncbi:cobyrinic acid a,c-diamide synthase [Marinilabiliaceae bacterium JC017]|nr:cobyrinic acid a,c-diamide synthase [Marinilabiliaceae bacterium JC017]
MPVKIAVASGKGGTGKTTVSVNLYHFIQKHWTESVQLLDCDVEEPNAGIFFPEAQEQYCKQVSQRVPTIDTDTCTFCRKCVEYCEFNAIVVIPPASFAEITPALCHSCGACLWACENGAITERPIPLGNIKMQNIGNNHSLLEGSLEIGSAMQTLLIKRLKKETNTNHDILLFDAPPGTSCPVVATIIDADYVILVSEPTPFGLNDLKLMVDLARELNKPFSVIINKAGLGDAHTHAFLEEENIELLGEIPFSRSFAEKYADGQLLQHIPEELEGHFTQIVENLKTKLS